MVNNSSDSSFKISHVRCGDGNSAVAALPTASYLGNSSQYKQSF